MSEPLPEIPEVMIWRDLPDRSTPTDAAHLNQWSQDLRLVAEAVEGYAVEAVDVIETTGAARVAEVEAAGQTAIDARDEAVAQVEFLAAPAIEQVAGYVDGVGGTQVVEALDATYVRGSGVGSATASALAAPTVTRENLVTNPAPASDTGWAYQSGTGEVSVTSFVASGGPSGGGGFLRRTITTAKTGGNSGFYRNQTGITGVAGDVVSGAMWVRSSHTVDLALNLTCRAGGSAVSPADLTMATLSPGVWTRLDDTDEATGAFDNAQLWAIMPGASVLPAGATIDVAQAIAEKAPMVGDYFDGSTPATATTENAWTGTAHASTSRQIVKPALRGALDEAYLPAAGALTYYVNPATGSDANAGTSSAPFKTVTKAIRRAEAVAQRRDTAVTINLAAGTYTERVIFSEFTAQNLSCTIAGPDVSGHPNRPTAIFSEGSNTSAIAILARNPNLVLTLKDLLFSGYRGTTSSCGAAVIGSTLLAVNVHTELCMYGLSAQHGVLDVKGGIFDNNGRLLDGSGSGAGVRSLMLTRHAIGTQNAGTLTAGPIFRNNRYGVYAQESSTGHVDWATFEDNERAVLLRVNSRANVDGSSFKRNGHAVSADSNSHVYVSPNVTFGSGGDANTRTTVLWSGAESTSTRYIDGVEVAQSRVERAITGLFTGQTITGTTTETDVLNRVLKAPFWNDAADGAYPPKRLRVRLVGTLTGTTGIKTVRLRVGTAQAGAVFAANETGVFVLEGWAYFVSPSRQVLAITTTRHLSASSRLASSVAALDMTADQTVRVTGQLGDATDSVSVDVVELAWG